MLAAPRPGYKRAWLNYRHGLPRPTGYRWLSGPSWYERPRRRSRLALSRGTLHYLGARRLMAAQCRQRGFYPIRPGLWYDRAGDVVYIQTDRIKPTSYISRGQR